eukprot:2510773-Rhodomonas_salina.2
MPPPGSMLPRLHSRVASPPINLHPEIKHKKPPSQCILYRECGCAATRLTKDGDHLLCCWVASPIVLRACYPMSGTNLLCAPTSLRSRGPERSRHICS